MCLEPWRRVVLRPSFETHRRASRRDAPQDEVSSCGSTLGEFLDRISDRYEIVQDFPDVCVAMRKGEVQSVSAAKRPTPVQSFGEPCRISGWSSHQFWRGTFSELGTCSPCDIPPLNRWSAPRLLADGWS